MKVCPFCKEDIKDDALKCRYCQSMLLALPVSASAPASTEDSGSSSGSHEV